jgi:hypothetical protein
MPREKRFLDNLVINPLAFFDSASVMKKKKVSNDLGTNAPAFLPQHQCQGKKDF